MHTYIHKVSGPDSVTLLERKSIFEWCVVSVDLRTDTRKGIMCLKESGQHAQILLTILSSIVYITGGTYMNIQ